MNIIWNIPETIFVSLIGIIFLAIIFHVIKTCRNFPKFINHAKVEGDKK